MILEESFHKLNASKTIPRLLDQIETLDQLIEDLREENQQLNLTIEVLKSEILKFLKPL